jgi:hypothetical protein
MATAQVRIDAASNGQSISATLSGTGNTEVNFDQSIAAGATNQNFIIALDVSQIKVIVIKSDQALTIKTNSSGSPTNTINLLAGVPYSWVYNANYNTLLLTGDVTSIYVTNAGASAARLQIVAVLDL